MSSTRRDWLVATTATVASVASAVMTACVRREEPRARTGPASSSAPGSGGSAVASATPSATGSAPSPLPEPEAAPYPTTEPKERLANEELDLHDWSLPGDRSLADRAVVLVPRHLARGERVPLLIALHGLAETASPEMGAYAWVRRYGVAEGYAHLRRPATISVDGLGKMATEARVSELRATLAESPFRGMVIACPYTPNLWRSSLGVEGLLDAYAKWLFDVLLPRLRAETPVLAGDAHLGVDGVSLGGYASLGVGARKWAQLGAVGCVQAAVSSGEAEHWAERFERARAASGARRLQVLTSTGDAFREGNEALDRALTKHAVPHDFRLAVGPHDQPFLRGPGSVEMLLWHDRALRG
jgi:enterochelin esterase-like enzyme